jgi:hypothetical protein
VHISIDFIEQIPDENTEEFETLSMFGMNVSEVECLNSSCSADDKLLYFRIKMKQPSVLK